MAAKYVTSHSHTNHKRCVHVKKKFNDVTIMLFYCCSQWALVVLCSVKARRSWYKFGVRMMELKMVTCSERTGICTCIVNKAALLSIQQEVSIITGLGYQ